jgi:hypothetical protein
MGRQTKQLAVARKKIKVAYLGEKDYFFRLPVPGGKTGPDTATFHFSLFFKQIKRQSMTRLVSFVSRRPKLAHLSKPAGI